MLVFFLQVIIVSYRTRYLMAQKISASKRQIGLENANATANGIWHLVFVLGYLNPLLFASDFHEADISAF